MTLYTFKKVVERKKLNSKSHSIGISGLFVELLFLVEFLLGPLVESRYDGLLFLSFIEISARIVS